MPIPPSRHEHGFDVGIIVKAIELPSIADR
jgi:hypothetical protein